MTSVVVIGVAGSGKSSVAGMLAERLGRPLGEGDDFHSEANLAKLRSGTPLTDDDRWPWLGRIGEWVRERNAAGLDVVVACSALRRSYRDRLRAAGGQMTFVQLKGSPELLAARIAARRDHVMPPTLLPSQLATWEPLEPDEDGFAVDIDQPVAQIVDQLVVALGGKPATAAPNERG